MSSMHSVWLRIRHPRSVHFRAVCALRPEERQRVHFCRAHSHYPFVDDFNRRDYRCIVEEILA